MQPDDGSSACSKPVPTWLLTPSSGQPRVVRFSRVNKIEHEQKAAFSAFSFNRQKVSPNLRLRRQLSQQQVICSGAVKLLALLQFEFEFMVSLASS